MSYTFFQRGRSPLRPSRVTHLIISQELRNEKAATEPKVQKPLASLFIVSPLDLRAWKVLAMHCEEEPTNVCSWAQKVTAKIAENDLRVPTLPKSQWKRRQGRNEGGKGGTIPGAPNHWGGRWKVSTMSHALSSIQYICLRKTSGSNMGAPNLLLAPGVIYPR